MELEQFKGQTRLPKFAVPNHYDLTLKPDLSACTFSGTVLIDLSVIQTTKFLVLNVLELVIHQDEVSFTNSEHRKYTPCDMVMDDQDEILILVFEDALSVGSGVLRICFSGILNEHLKGFYKCTYMDGGEKKNAAVTQFEAVEARRCFPCWDEPALKATFKVTVESIPSELTALSNMPASMERLEGEFKTVHFEKSPLMSTYLVAVVVGLFDFIEDATNDGIKVRVYSPVGESLKGKFALSVAVQALEFFKEYFSVPYPLPKLDMVAVPEFACGAMENYGLITYREIELLQDDLHSAVANTQRRTIVVAHEVAHQWFGNLVTMEWWTHLWLNEGFATWVSYLVTDKLFPEWKIWSRFLEETISGLRMDALDQSHPVEVEIHHARSVDEVFDEISYQKGSSVIRMLQDYLGDDVFRKSLGSYMKRFACGNAKTEDLWNVLSEISAIEVKEIMNIWTKQKGYPLISVKLKDRFLEFEQSQFSSSGLHGDSQWIVPITLSLGSYNQQKRFLMKTKMEKMDLCIPPYQSPSTYEMESPLDMDESMWVKLNVGQAGFYRVKYDNDLTARLKKAITHNILSVEDEFGILDDAFAFCEACEVPLSSLLSLMDVYRKDLDYIVLSRLIDICYKLVEISNEAIVSLVADLKRYFINLLLFVAEKLGWEEVPRESQSRKLMREDVLIALARFDHPQTHEEANKRFQAYLDDRTTSLLPVETRKAAYIAVMRNTSHNNRNGFESLLKVYRESDSIQEKSRVLRCIGSCPDPEVVLSALNFMLSKEFRDPDAVYVLAGICFECRTTAWMWLKENWDLILKKWGAGMILPSFVRNIVTPFCSHEMADEVEAFFSSRMNPSITMNLKQSLERVRNKARWSEHIKQEPKESLEVLLKG